MKTIRYSETSSVSFHYTIQRYIRRYVTAWNEETSSYKVRSLQASRVKPCDYSGSLSQGSYEVTVVPLETNVSQSVTRWELHAVMSVWLHVASVYDSSNRWGGGGSESF
jgi:hypothetical protein